MSKQTLETLLSADGETQYASEHLGQRIDSDMAHLATREGVEYVSMPRQTCEALIETARVDVLYTEPVYSMLCERPEPKKGQYCAHGTTTGRNSGWFKLAGALRVYGDMLRELENDYCDLEEWSRDKDAFDSDNLDAAQSVKMYLAIAHNGVSTLEYIKRRLQMTLGALSGHGGYTRDELSMYVEIIRLYSESARGLVRMLQSHMAGNGEHWATLGAVQGRVAYLSGAFDWVVNGLKDCSERITWAKAPLAIQ